MASKFFNTIKKKIDKVDVRRLREISVEVIKEYEKLTTVFNSMNEGVLVVDNDWNVILLNNRMGSLLGLSSKAIGQKIEEVVENQEVLKVISHCLENEEKIVDKEIILNNEYSTYSVISIQPLVQEGKIIGNIIKINDISQRKENEKRLKQAESLAALTTISAGIAHEIKNPLGAVSIHVQLIQQEIKKCQCELVADIKYSVEIVGEEIDRLTEIVKNFLYTVRPLKAELMLINLKYFLDRLVQFISPELEAKNIVLKKKYQNLPDLWLDEKYFRQAMINLIQNSIASIEECGIIEIEAFREKNYVFINIIDNGKGIDEDLQSKIFDPYFTTKKSGTGLGLTIVYKIIKEHNGEINFTSEPGKTVFTIRLPVPFIEKGLIEYSP